MKMDLQIPIISCDQVKVATLVIFFTFSEKFPLFYKKVEITEKSFCKKQKKQKNMRTCTFATLRRAQMGATGSFSSNYGEIHHNSPIIGELLLISRFGVNSTHFRPKAVTLTWSHEIIEFFLSHLRNYHVFGEIPQLLVNSTVLVKFGEFHVFRVFRVFGGHTHLPAWSTNFFIPRGRMSKGV